MRRYRIADYKVIDRIENISTMIYPGCNQQWVIFLIKNDILLYLTNKKIP